MKEVYVAFGRSMIVAQIIFAEIILSILYFCIFFFCSGKQLESMREHSITMYRNGRRFNWMFWYDLIKTWKTTKPNKCSDTNQLCHFAAGKKNCQKWMKRRTKPEKKCTRINMHCLILWPLVHGSHTSNPVFHSITTSVIQMSHFCMNISN